MSAEKIVVLVLLCAMLLLVAVRFAVRKAQEWAVRKALEACGTNRALRRRVRRCETREELEHEYDAVLNGIAHAKDDDELEQRRRHQ